MATKKTNNSKQEKQYLVVDNTEDIIAIGTMDEITEALDEFKDDDGIYDEIPFDEWISECTIYELTNAKKIKYTPAKYTF